MRNPRLAWLLTLFVASGLLLAVPAWAGEHGGGKGKGKSGQKDKDDDQDQGDEVKGQGKGKGGDKGKGGGEAGEGEGAGKEHEKGGPHAGKEPPGWDKGKKKGWEDDYPPGWDKKTEDEKGKWKKDVQDAKDEVGLHADAKGINAEEKARLQEAVERISRKGKEVKEATTVTIEGLKKGRRASEILAEHGIVVEVGK